MKHWKSSLQIKMIFLYLILVVVPINVWGLMNIWMTTNEVEELLVENTKEIVRKQLEGLDRIYTRASEVTVQLMLDNQVKKELLEYNGELNVEGTERYNNLKAALENIMVQNSEFSNIALISEAVLKENDPEKPSMITTGYLGSIEELKKTVWYPYTRYIYNVPLLVQFEPVENDQEKNEKDMMFLMAYKDVRTNKKLGTLCIKVSKISIEKNFSIDDGMGVQQIVYDKMGNIVYDTTQDVELRGIMDEQYDYCEEYLSVLNYDIGGGYLILKGRSGISGTSVVYAVPKKEIFSTLWKIQGLNLLGTVLCMFFSIIVLGIFFHKVLKPVVKMQREMKKVEEGDFDISIPKVGEDEIGRLAKCFYHMIISIDEKNKQIILGEKKKREYEIKLLQAQITPHFLYNTLDSIKWMAVTQGEKTIARMAQLLGQLLRKTISDNKEFVRLKEEMECIRCYVEIQKLRYYDSFDYYEEIEAICEDVLIPRLTLQPLIENALFHGVYNCGRRGKIQVDIRKIGETVHIVVTDNGRGMDVQEIVNKNKNSDRISKIGIQNVNERIKLYYGQDFGLEYESVKGEFTKALIKIPFRERKESKEESNV